MDRRSFLKMAGIASCISAFPNILQANAAVPYKKSLSFYNIHTGETLTSEFWAEGAYIPDALAQFNHILRDHRSGMSTQMDVELFDLLYAIRSNLNSREPFQIISGYRSAATNAALRDQSSGVAKKSLHMQGMAIDINLPGRNLAELRKVAMAQKQGGVGYYPASNFVHIDVGRPRYW